MNFLGSEQERCNTSRAQNVRADGNFLCPISLLETALQIDLQEDEEACDALDLGETCGGYRLIRVIGRGGTGVVYLAEHPDHPTRVALKMLASARAARPEDLRRFRLEADATMELRHPNIVRILDRGEEDGVPWFVMDYMSGGSLADELERNADPYLTRAKLQENVRLFAMVARAVQHAHERGIIHRDLKPANILLDAAGIPYIADFGLARLIHEPSGVTMTGAVVGTPAYMAPEQAAGNIITTLADGFSLGAIFFHLITGKPPFEAPTPLETLRLVSSQDASDPRTIAPWIDRDLAMICLKALRRERNARYGSAADLAEDLESWLRGESVTARPLPLHERLMKWCKRHPVSASLFGAATVAAAVFAIIIVGGILMLKEERNHAVHHEAEARLHAQSATQARDESRLHSYAADMYLAYRAYEDGHLGLARRTMQRQQPSPELPDLRGFEWHALDQLCRGDDLKTWHDHQGAVCCVSFSPDGKFLASGSRDGLVVIRSMEDGKTLLDLPRADAPHGLNEIAWMTKVLSQSSDSAALLLSSGSNFDEFRMRSRPSKLGEITSLAWSPDGKRLATAGLGSYVRIWSMPSGDVIGVIPIKTATALAFTADNQFLVTHLHKESDCNHYETMIYRLNGLSQVRVISDLTGSQAVSPADDRIATISRNGTKIQFTEAVGGKDLGSIEPNISLKRIVFSHDGQTLHGVDSMGTTVGSWSVAHGQRIGVIFPVSGKFDLFQPSSCGDFFASTGAAQRITWQHKASKSPAVCQNGHEDVIRALAVSVDGKWIATGGNDHSVRVWRTAPEATSKSTADIVASLDIPEKVLSMAASPALIARVKNGYWISKELRGEMLHLVSQEGKVMRTMQCPSPHTLRLLASETSRYVALFLWPRSVIVSREDGNSWNNPWRLSSGTVGPIIFSPDGSLLASGGDDNTISIRNTSDGKLIAQLKGHQGAIVDLIFAPDARTLLSSSEDKTIRLWHCATWRDMGVLHRGETVRRMAFDPSGQTIYAQSADGIQLFGR